MLYTSPTRQPGRRPCARWHVGLGWRGRRSQGGPRRPGDLFRDEPMTHASSSRLLELFRSRALFFGDFTLASGQKSTYYINSKRVLFHSECAAMIGDAFYE